MGVKQMALIYIVEDDASVRELIRYTLQSAEFEVQAFESGENFLQAMEEAKDRVELVLLDIMLPGISGLEVFGKLQSAGYKIPVIFLTAKNTEIDKVTGLEMGADDYIAKPFGVLELIARVKAALRRTHGHKTTDLRAGIVRMNLAKRKAYVAEQEVPLTYKEFEMLHYLMANEGIVLSREQFLNRIWDAAGSIETRTVDMHIKTLRAKLGQAGACIKTVRSVGYLFSSTEED